MRGAIEALIKMPTILYRKSLTEDNELEIMSRYFPVTDSIEIMVDRASGYDAIQEQEIRKEAKAFIEFVYKYVYLALKD